MEKLITSLSHAAQNVADAWDALLCILCGAVLWLYAIAAHLDDGEARPEWDHTGAP